MTANPGNEWMVWLPIALSPLPIAIALWQLRVSRQLLRRGIRTTATYVGAVRSRTSSDPSTGTRYAVVEFRTADGQTHRYRTMLGVPWAARDEGGSVTILYHPSDPKRARLATFTELWMPSLIAGGVGVGFLVTGVVSLILLS